MHLKWQWVTIAIQVMSTSTRHKNKPWCYLSLYQSYINCLFARFVFPSILALHICDPYSSTSYHFICRITTYKGGCVLSRMTHDMIFYCTTLLGYKRGLVQQNRVFSILHCYCSSSSTCFPEFASLFYCFFQLKMSNPGVLYFMAWQEIQFLMSCPIAHKGWKELFFFIYSFFIPFRLSYRVALCPTSSTFSGSLLRERELQVNCLTSRWSSIPLRLTYP